MARKTKHAAGHDNEERWLLTYADMITLLVAFFIMLYAMSVTNSAKFNSLAISVRSGFGNPVPDKPSILDGMGAGTPDTKITVNMPKKPSTDLGKSRDGANQTSKNGAKAEQLLKKLQKLLAQNDLSKHVSVRMEERGIVVTVLADKYSFDSGSAEMKPSLKPILDGIASVIKTEPNSIRIEGHTDDLPISNDRFPSNWQLSAVRAANVLCYFVSNSGLSPDRVNCVGYADRRPISANSTEQNRAKNRRVEIVILKEPEDTGHSDDTGNIGESINKTWQIGPGLGPHAAAG
ncbi:MAG: flagellar motor protein MotB [Capsulimonadaceae bacterium]|nr:flagellar motor protein MotB [Capsulimonadaceae bacterium]